MIICLILKSSRDSLQFPFGRPAIESDAGTSCASMYSEAHSRAIRFASHKKVRFMCISCGFVEVETTLLIDVAGSPKRNAAFCSSCRFSSQSAVT